MVELRIVGMRNPRRIAAAAASILALAAPPAFAWGPLGHRIVAETAALLVQDDLPDGWGPLLARHRFELGAYAYVPDAVFRNIDGNGGATEARTHVLELDLPAEARGTVDRRAAQFLARATAQLGAIRALRGGYVHGLTAEGELRRAFLGLFELGVMAHYSGDASMPYHATADTNGYARGEGGIHFYFEGACVEAFEPGLAADVLASARAKRAAWIAAWSAGPSTAPDALVRALIRDSFDTVDKVARLDLRSAVVRLAPAGSTDDAIRKPAAEGCRAMRSLLVERLAKGAALTAALWERALPRDADLSGARDLRYADMVISPEFVPPEPAAAPTAGGPPRGSTSR